MLGLGPDGDIEADKLLEGDRDEELEALREIEADSDGLGPLGEIDADGLAEIEALALPTDGEAEIDAE